MTDGSRREDGSETGDQLDELVDDLAVSETDAESVVGGATAYVEHSPSTPLPPPIPYPNVAR